MAASKSLVFLAAVAALLSLSTTAATTKATKLQFMWAHNKARAAVGVRRLRWSENLSSTASRLAAQQQGKDGGASCELSDQAVSSSHGANQAVTNFMASPEKVVGSWVEEGRRYYDHGYNSCAAGHEKECEAYTQVVWKKTVELGCGKANCGKDGSLTICLYYPPGNVRGESPY